MKVKTWLRNNWEIAFGGWLPLIAFAVIWLLSFFEILSGWVGLGVFAFSTWIALFLNLMGLAVSVYRYKTPWRLRNLWFLPGVLVFAFTIGANGLENLWG